MRAGPARAKLIEGSSTLSAAMRIELDDPTAVSDLLAFLRRKPHVVADRVGERELEVSLLGSRNRASRRLELELLVQVWHAASGHSAQIVSIG
jgi:hypothetical protein